MSEAPVAPGWFGKLPALGDFASRRLPPRFVGAWDDWLQHGIGEALDRHGGGWLDRFAAAPPCRFWIACAALGATPWAGVLAPSRDRVGRRFTLTVAAPAGDAAAAQAAQQWFDAIERCARSACDGGTVEQLEEALLAVGALPGAGGRVRPAASRWWRDDGFTQAFDGLPPAPGFASLFATDGLR